jgi:hypothetical protein
MSCSLFEDLIIAIKHRIIDEEVRQLVFSDVLEIFREQKLLGLLGSHLGALDEAFLKAYKDVSQHDHNADC